MKYAMRSYFIAAYSKSPVMSLNGTSFFSHNEFKSLMDLCQSSTSSLDKCMFTLCNASFTSEPISIDASLNDLIILDALSPSATHKKLKRYS